MCSKNIPHLTPLRLSHPTHPWHSWLRRDFLLRGDRNIHRDHSCEGGQTGGGGNCLAPHHHHMSNYIPSFAFTHNRLAGRITSWSVRVSACHTSFEIKKKNTSRNSPWGCRSKAMTLTLSMNEFLWPCDPSKILRKCSHLLTTPRSHLDDHGHGKQGVALFCFALCVVPGHHYCVVLLSLNLAS